MSTAVKWVTAGYFSEHTGYTVEEIRDNQVKGYWKENEVWCYTPDGDQLFNIERYEQWVEGKL